MADRDGIFAGDDPFAIARSWLEAAEAAEVNDPNAIALATVDPEGLPNVRMVLLKEIESDAFVFYTNYGSVKAGEIDHGGKAAFVMHWKSLRRQIRVRGTVTREAGEKAEEGAGTHRHSEDVHGRPWPAKSGAYARSSSPVLYGSKGA